MSTEESPAEKAAGPLVNGHQVKLSTGAEVWVGNYEGQCCIRITNKEGLPFQFRLSKEATVALLDMMALSGFYQMLGFEA